MADVGPEVRLPPVLRPGGHVRVISPSKPDAPFPAARARRAEDVLAAFDLRVSYGAHVAMAGEGPRSAGGPEQRAADFMEAFADPAVDAVFSAAGGVGAVELLPWLDGAVPRANPKPFIGECTMSG